MISGKLNKELERLLSDQEGITLFLNQLKQGNSEISKNNIKETKSFDEEWIDTLESYLPSINNIISNPKSELKRTKELVLVERVRKVDSHTVKHLASNTKNIRKVAKDGTVIPNKLQTTHTNVHYETYENRFIKTLIDRLFRFINDRYQIISDNIQSTDKTKINLNTEFPINDSKVKIDFNMELERDLDNKKHNEYNNNLLKRVSNLKTLISGLYRSEFMRDLSKAKSVKSPINKTIVILKNPDYNNSYLLWLFLDQYDELPYSSLLEQSKYKFSCEEISKIEQLIIMNYLTLLDSSNNEQFITMENTELKSIKQNIDSPGDFVNHPLNIRVENNTANEYYLNTFTKLFDTSIEEHKKHVKLDETALKRAMRDLNEITNSLYKSYFHFEQDRDVFKRLLKEENPFDQFNQLKEKLSYAKVIREVNEVQYNNSIRLERRLMKDILSLDNYLKQASIENKVISAKNLEEDLLNEHNLNEITEHDKYLLESLSVTKENKEKIKQEEDKATKTIDELIKTLKEEETAYINEYRKMLEKKYKAEIEKIRLDNKNKIKRLNDKYQKELREKDLETIERIKQVHERNSLNKAEVEKDLTVFFNNKTKEYQKELDKRLLEAKIIFESVEIKAEIERNKKLNQEIYSKR